MDRSIADFSACVLAEISSSGGGAPGIFNYGFDMPGPDDLAVKSIPYHSEKVSRSVISLAFRIKDDGFRIFDGQKGHHIAHH
jgi:hypothetical protein